MKLNPKVTGALAWTGLVLVLAVPAADMLGGKPEAKANLTSDMDQVQTASVKPSNVQPVTTKPVASDDAVETFVQSGKKLPSYISGADAPVTETASVPAAPVKKPGTVTINPDGTIDRPAAATPEPEVAALSQVAPIPLPASARPTKPAVSLPSTTTAATNEVPLILDENEVASTGPLPPQDIIPEDQLIGGDQLDEWDSGSLADYLARRGLMSDASQAAPAADEQYDPDGFFLSDGPNGPRRSRVIVIER